MTQEEQAQLTDYLVDAGEIDPDGGVERQFLDWYRVREETVYRETHYKAILDAARMRVKSSRRDGRLAWPRARRSWAGTSWRPARAFTASWIMSTGRRVNSRDPSKKTTWRPLTGADRRVLCPEDSLVAVSGGTARLWPFWEERSGHE